MTPSLLLDHDQLVPGPQEFAICSALVQKYLLPIAQTLPPQLLFGIDHRPLLPAHLTSARCILIADGVTDSEATLLLANLSARGAVSLRRLVDTSDIARLPVAVCS